MHPKMLKSAGEHHHVVDWLADVVAVISGLALYPQVWKSLHAAERSDLSTTTFAIITVTSLVWVWYGAHRKSLPVVVSSGLNFLAGTALLILSLTQV